MAAKIIRIPSVEVIDTKVAGVSRDNADGSSRQEIISSSVHEDDKIVLVVDEPNEYDPDAVKVLTLDGSQIGYLNRDIAPKVKNAMENEAEIHCKVSWVSGKQYIGVGLRIELVS